MSVDPEKAIEKLAEYRKDSQTKKDTAESKRRHIGPFESKIRKLLIRFHWVNGAYLTMLTVYSLIALFISEISPIWWLFGLILNIILTRQTFVVIDRLADSDGRYTLFDDVFLMFLVSVTFFELVPAWADILGNVVFSGIHLILFLIWMSQIFFINYRKPDLEYIPPAKDVKIKENLGLVQNILSFFTPKRIPVLSVGLILGIAASLPFF